MVWQRWSCGISSFSLIMCSLCMCGLQGLFRVAPSASKLKKLKASLDCGVVDVQEYSSDPHAIAGAKCPCLKFPWQPPLYRCPVHSVVFAHTGGHLRVAVWFSAAQSWLFKYLCEIRGQQSATAVLSAWTKILLVFFFPEGALKSYLRELPEPLMTLELYDEWIQASKWVAAFLIKDFVLHWHRKYRWKSSFLTSELSKWSHGMAEQLRFNEFLISQHPRYGQETTSTDGHLWKTPYRQLKQLQVSPNSQGRLFPCGHANLEPFSLAAVHSAWS